MIDLVLRMEDLMLVAEWWDNHYDHNGIPQIGEGQPTLEHRWKVMVLDQFTGATHRCWLTVREMTVLMTLTFANDGDAGPEFSAFYPEAEAILQGWPDEVRPIP